MNLAASSGSGGSAALGFVFIILGIAAYWVPTIVVLSRRPKPPNLGSVIVINAFLGWTVVGWVVSLAMAVRTRPQPQQGYSPSQGYGPPGYGPPQGYGPPPGYGPPQDWQPQTPPGQESSP